MSQLAPFSPDDIYCVYCHARASGPCATCGALVCTDCCEITGGSVRKVAVCKSCAKKGRGHVGLRQIAPLLLLVGLLLLVLFMLAWLTSIL